VRGLLRIVQRDIVAVNRNIAGMPLQRKNTETAP
jgi:hypothetical protein